MFGWNIEMAEEGMTVPYPPLFDNVRSNEGFCGYTRAPGLGGQVFLNVCSRWR